MTIHTQAPVRLQRSRAKGSRLVSPNGLPVVYVGRPGKWGNPYRVYRNGDGEYSVSDSRGDLVIRRCKLKEDALIISIARFRTDLILGLLPFTIEDVIRELAGKNLACWCPLGTPCHADVLLRVANGGEP